MNEDNLPLLKRMDLFLFQKLDQFRQTPSYARIQEGYAALDEQGQQMVKAGLLAATLLFPLLFLGSFWLRNRSIAQDVRERGETVARMQEIIAQKAAAGGLVNRVAAPEAFPDQETLRQRLSAVLSSAAVDPGKIQINNFEAVPVSDALTRAEADFKFEGLTTAQLVGLFTGLISQQRFRIASVSITRNEGSNLLDGAFHGVHFGQNVVVEEE